MKRDSVSLERIKYARGVRACVYTCVCVYDVYFDQGFTVERIN